MISSSGLSLAGLSCVFSTEVEVAGLGPSFGIGVTGLSYTSVGAAACWLVGNSRPDTVSEVKH